MEFEDKLKFYEQKYFTNEIPMPFNKVLNIYPILVKDYYTFYSLISCFTINKNEDPDGVGISKSHLDYIFYLMEKEESGKFFTEQFFSLLELVFRIKNGFICTNPECDSEFILYEDFLSQFEQFSVQISNLGKEEQIMVQKKYLEEFGTCPKCGSDKQELLNITIDENNRKHLYIGHIEITRNQYDELRRIVCYQNIPDYDDEYIDPDLKAALEETAQLKNPNNVQPTLEKQMACIITGSSYTYESLMEMSIRKFVLLLRTIDKKLHYLVYKQGEAGGMITFKNEIEHWIYSNSDARKDKFKDLVSVDSFKKKMQDAT